MMLKNILYKIYPPLINLYTVWLLYMLFFLDSRDNPQLPYEIKNIPLDTVREYFFHVFYYDKIEFLKNIFGNIILFIPYGFLGILYPILNQFKWTLISFFIIINIVEFSQYYFNRGMADIDDVILNTSGAVIGFFIYKKCFFIKGR